MFDGEDGGCVFGLQKPVILDAVFITKQKGDPYGAVRRILEGYPLLMVNVRCPAEELARREKERGDRNIGQAVAPAAHSLPKAGYDLTVDTFAETTAVCAERICSLIAEKNSPTQRHPG